MQPNHIYLIYIYQQDLALNSQQWLICHKTQPNPTNKKNILVERNTGISYNLLRSKFLRNIGWRLHHTWDTNFFGVNVVYSYSDSCRTQRHNEDERHSLLEKYTSHFIWKVCVWEGIRGRTERQYIYPHSYGYQRCVFFVLQGCSTGGLLAHSAGYCSLYRILSPMSLVSKLTDFLSSPSYIRVQSPTQYLPITGHRDVSLPMACLIVIEQK